MNRRFWISGSQMRESFDFEIPLTTGSNLKWNYNERHDPRRRRSAYYALSDALQHLGNVAFRNPVPAYKHSAAIFLHLTRRIPSPRTHLLNPARPASESEILRDCAHRLGLETR